MQLLDFFFNFESVHSYNIANQVEGVGWKIFAIDLDHIKTMLRMTEDGTWQERNKYRKHKKGNKHI